MPDPTSAIALDQFTTFGDLLRYLRRRAGLTQRELSIAVGYSDAQISRLEQNQRPPDLATLTARFVPALGLEDEPKVVARFLELAEIARRAVTPAHGQEIRGYELRERIGAGGFGEVYRAYQPSVGREVAIKVILPQHANHPDFIRRFEAEAQLVARLEHPHIVPLYDYWREPEGAYLVMRWLRSGSLRGALAERGPWAVEAAARLLDHIAGALAIAHRQGVVHRDIKPENILLDEEGNAYLSDFGIAKDVAQATGMTEAEGVSGSLAYISPEQAQSKPVTAQSDLYSLGVVLYEVLTGEHPFPGVAPTTQLLKHLSEPLPSLRERRPELPEALEAVIQRATAKDPADRYPEAWDVAAAFREGLRPEAGHVPVASPARLELAGLAAPNPYKGLRAFQEADAADFFGREALTQHLLARLRDNAAAARFLAVVGPSGSGKSSVVKASLIPALRRGGLPGSDKWFIVEMLPGAFPWEELEAALLRIAVNPPESLLGQLREDERGLMRAVKRALPDDETELVLVIDQFEEFFTLLADEAARAQFLANLEVAVTDPHSRVRVIITLRADFYDRPLLYAGLGELMRQRTEVVLPLAAAELARAIREPAERAGATLETGLVTAIVADVNEQPGALPLLQYALTELFERREGRLLTKAAYQSIGGVLGALARRAEEVFASLDEAGQAAARQLFLRLVTLGEGTEDTRRRVLRSELESLGANPAPASQFPMTHLQPRSASLRGQLSPISTVIETFGKARLLSFDRDLATRGPTVEVAHEALLREWGRLREWLNESRADVRLQRLLAHAAAEWQSANRDMSFLLTGARLEQFEGWAANTSVALTRDERAFLDASIAERDKRAAEERERQQRELEAARKLAETERARAESEKQRAEEQVRYVARVRTRNRVIAAAGGIALVLAVLAGLFGLQSNQNATLAQQNLSAAQIANTQSAANAATAQAASTLAFENADTANTEKQNALESQAEAEYAAKVAFSRELAFAAIANLDVDPERSILLAMEAVSQTYTIDQTALPEAEDALHRAVGASRVQHTLPSHPTSWTRLAFSPDGTRLATDVLGGKTIWDTATGKALFTLPLKDGASFDVVFSLDGTRVTTVDADRALKNVVTVKAWDLLSGQQVLTTPLSVNFNDFVWEVSHSTTTGSGNALPVNTDELVWDTFSPDGRLYATALNDGRVRIWDTATGALLRTIAAQSIYLNRLAFNHEGTKLAANAEFNTVWIWDVGTGQLLATLFGHTKAINVAFSPDGPRFAIANGDFTATLWNAASGQELRTLFGHANDVTVVKFSPDGRRVATASWDRKVIMWDSATGQQLFTLSGHTGVIWDLAFSPDGTRLATYSTDGTVKLWDVSPGGELPTLPIQAFGSSAFNSEHTRIAVAQPDITVGIWDMATGKALLTLTDPLGIYTVAFSPDGTRLVTTSPPNRALMVWDAATGEQLLKLTDLDVLDATFSRDGTRIVTAHADGSVNVWEAATGKLSLHLGIKHEAAVWTVAYSRDGSRIVSAAEDGTIKVWDAETGQELLSLLHTSNIGIKIPWGLDFSPDGKRFVTGSQAGTAKVWDLQTGQELLTLSGHTGTIYRAAYSPDGTQIATAAYDSNSTAKVWDATTGKLLLTLYGATKGLNGITFSLDGKRLITVSDDGNLRTYPLRLEDELALARSRLTRTWRPEECQQYLHVEACP